MSISDSQSLLTSDDLVPAESSGDLPELDDDDLIADGGTEVMRRQAAFAAAETESKNAPVPVSIPLAPSTAPMLPPVEDDREEAQRRIDRTQPFDRAAIFGATPTPPSAAWPVAPVATRPTSIAPMAMDTPVELPVVNYLPTVPTSPVISLAIGGALMLCAALLVTFGVRSLSAHQASPPVATVAPAEAQTIPARRDVEIPEPPAKDDEDMPVISSQALPSAPHSPAAPARVNAGAKKRGRPTGR